MTTKEEPTVSTTEVESPLAHLTPEQIDELEKEFNAIHDEVFSELVDLLGRQVSERALDLGRAHVVVLLGGHRSISTSPSGALMQMRIISPSWP